MEAAAAMTPEEFTPEEFRPVVEAWPWVESKWSRETKARHEYVMYADIKGEGEFHTFYKLIRAYGYKAVWGPNPETGKSYRNMYLDLGDYTYWWITRCMNREHKSVREAGETLRYPASAEDAQAQLF